VEVENELVLGSPTLELETEIRSRSRFESDVLRALAGVDVELGRTLAARFESSAGGGDFGVRFQLLWNLWSWTPPTPPPPPPSSPQLLDEEKRRVERLEAFQADGPEVEKLTSRLFRVRGPVRGNWPVVVDYQLEQDGYLELEIETPGRRKVYKLRGKTGVRKDPIRLLPRKLGRRLEMALLTARAFARKSREPISFRLYGIGVGEGAVASVAIQQKDYWPPSDPVTGIARWEFICRADVNNAEANVYLQFPGEGSDIDFTDTKLVRTLEYRKDIGRNACPLTADRPCIVEWDRENEAGQLSSGPHVLEMEIFHTERGDWGLYVTDVFEIEDTGE
jgi:hypothetical protein